MTIIKTLFFFGLLAGDAFSLPSILERSLEDHDHEDETSPPDDDHQDLHLDSNTTGHDGSKPWGQVIGATLLINLVTLIGVIFLVPMMTTAIRNHTLAEAWKNLVSNPDIVVLDARKHRLFDIAITSFACGALLATTFFLIVPEAMILVNAEDSGDDEGDSHAGHNHRFLQDEGGHQHADKSWVFGTSALAGFLLPMVLASFFPHTHSPQVLQCETIAVETRDEPAEHDVRTKTEDGHPCHATTTEGQGTVNPTKAINQRLVSGIILGDSLHNFADGVFVGVAFLLCDSSLAWSILASTIYHELAQEISDFFLLTQHAHLPPLIALVLNFLSGLSVTLGGLLVLATNVSSFTLGVVLSMSSGVYINVAAKECMPTVDRLAVTIPDRVLAFVAFAIGAVPIGLVLLKHQHCEA